MFNQKFPKDLSMCLRGGFISLVAVFSLSESVFAQSFEISNSTQSGGGGISSDAEFSVIGTIGQAATGPMRNGEFQFLSGYLATETITCAPTDLNCDDVTDGVDLGILLLGLGDCPSLEACCEGDINSDSVIDSLDVGLMLINWG